jgi:hypothetical protein
VNNFLNIKHEIIEKAKAFDANIKVFTFSMDNESSTEQVNQVVEALRHAIVNGDWVIIDNVHMIDYWPKQILNLVYVRSTCFSTLFTLNLNLNLDFKSIKDAKYSNSNDLKMEYSNLKDFYLETSLEGGADLPGSVDTEIHAKYRLWLISDSDSVGKIPSILKTTLLR